VISNKLRCTKLKTGYKTYIARNCNPTDKINAQTT
jgi:hypothetical protein